MKQFIIKCFVFLLLTGGSVIAFYVVFELNFSDRFYAKFLHKTNSMIVGSSRALLGLDPESIAKTYPDASGMLNFAFTQRTSPYGEVYYDAICKKLTGADNGIFIVEVSPLSLFAGQSALPEEKLVLGELTFFNLDPNPEYVLNNSEHPFYLDMFSRSRPDAVQVSHPSGWLENTVNDDGVKKEKKLMTQRAEYDTLFSTTTLSDYRLEWLRKTVQLFTEHGTVVMVRIPVTAAMDSMETGYCPQFDSLMLGIAKQYGATYIHDDLGQECLFADMHHMLSASARSYSIALGAKLNEVAKQGSGEQ